MLNLASMDNVGLTPTMKTTPFHFWATAIGATLFTAAVATSENDEKLEGRMTLQCDHGPVADGNGNIQIDPVNLE